MIKKKVTIIGGGPAAMMLAASLNRELFDISIYEKNKSLGRKFLVAGNGGFNLTHSEEKEQFIKRYSPSGFFEKIINEFSNKDLIQWLKTIGIETYTGTSKRIFPVKGIKPIQVLNSILHKLKENEVNINYDFEWCGWNTDGELLFKNGNKMINIKSEITVFALGGASWKITGSDSKWTDHFMEKGIKIIPFQASNCAYKINWNKDLIAKLEGQALKNISISCGDITKKGEVVLTLFGMEGSGIYGLSQQIRKQLDQNREAVIYIDLKPTLSLTQIVQKTSGVQKKNWTKTLSENLNLTTSQLELLRSVTTKDEFTDLEKIAEKIKQIPITINGTANIDEAISTVGGIDLNEIMPNFELKKLPANYIIGEMLDWDAPTGGYLLQACFSMGKCLAVHLNNAD